MKKWTRNLLALIMAVALVGCGSALAAEETTPAPEKTVAVQLDGQNLTFTDAIPQVKDQRTFLPFRAVFEAMGAEVGYEGTTITAKRGDKDLTMTIGSTEAVVTENGVETPIVMDVAPYVDNTTWRTYVPVRFAAQAFDCNVGWDQANYTAIIVDTEKLMDEVLEGKSFTYLEKYLEYSKKYQNGIWDMDMTFDGGMTLMGAPITFAGTAVGTTEGSEKMDMDMTMTMDMTQFIAYMEEMAESAAQQSGAAAPETTASAMTPEEEAMLEALATEGIGISMRGDMAEGLMYMNLSGSILEQAGMPADTWLSMDLAATYAQLGLDWSEVMAMTKDLDYGAIIDMLLKEIELTDATTDYAMMKMMVEKVADILSDQSFVKNGNKAVNSFKYTEAGAGIEITMTLVLSNDKVVGYDLTCALNAADETGTPVLDFAMYAAVDAKDQMEANISMDMAGVLGMSMNMEGDYTKGNSSPAVVPPAGVTVVPYESLMTPAA